MPHVIVKLWPGKSAQQKRRLAEAITRDVATVLNYGDESVVRRPRRSHAYGLTQPQAAEVLTHLAFYTGWPSVFSALPVAKDVFEKRPR
jgi:alkylhydroperoxidase/carboxymuconolactone decarboxylase family protein YurZ